MLVCMVGYLCVPDIFPIICKDTISSIKGKNEPWNGQYQYDVFYMQSYIYIAINNHTGLLETDDADHTYGTRSSKEKLVGERKPNLEGIHDNSGNDGV